MTVHGGHRPPMPAVRRRNVRLTDGKPRPTAASDAVAHPQAANRVVPSSAPATHGSAVAPGVSRACVACDHISVYGIQDWGAQDEMPLRPNAARRYHPITLQNAYRCALMERLPHS